MGISAENVGFAVTPMHLDVRFFSISRTFGGTVSWDKTVAIGATYQETDESITHQVVDRPMVEKQYLSRWVLPPPLSGVSVYLSRWVLPQGG